MDPTAEVVHPTEETTQGLTLQSECLLMCKSHDSFPLSAGDLGPLQRLLAPPGDVPYLPCCLHLKRGGPCGRPPE